MPLHHSYNTGCIRPGDRLVSLVVLTPSHANVCRIREYDTIYGNARLAGNRQEMPPLGEIKVAPVNDGDLAPRQGIAAQTFAFPSLRLPSSSWLIRTYLDGCRSVSILANVLFPLPGIPTSKIMSFPFLFRSLLHVPFRCLKSERRSTTPKTSVRRLRVQSFANQQSY